MRQYAPVPLGEMATVSPPQESELAGLVETLRVAARDGERAVADGASASLVVALTTRETRAPATARVTELLTDPEPPVRSHAAAILAFAVAVDEHWTRAGELLAHEDDAVRVGTCQGLDSAQRRRIQGIPAADLSPLREALLSTSRFDRQKWVRDRAHAVLREMRSTKRR
jgi:hypothetical protein